MRFFIPVVLIAASLTAGCQSDSHTHRDAHSGAYVKAFEPMMVTRYGTRTTSDGTWRIGVAEHSLDLSHAVISQGKDFVSSGWVTDSPSGWKARGGWFVYVESPGKVWAFDGGAVLYFLQVKGNKGTLYGASNLPCRPPKEVYSRLSIPVKRDVDRRR